MNMKKYIEKITGRTIVQEICEADCTSYYNADEELLAEVYLHEDGAKECIFYPELLETEGRLTKQQLAPLVEQVKQVFEQPDLVLASIVEVDDRYVVELRKQEPKHGVIVRGSGMDMTVNVSGQLEEVLVYANDVDIIYPDMMISKEEAARILQGQQLVQLTISGEHGWRYMYGQNFDLYGVAPNGNVRFWHDEPSMKGAGYEDLPEVEPVADFDAYLISGRKGEIYHDEQEDVARWRVDSEELKTCDEQHYTRACRILKTLVGTEYVNYKLEVYPNLYEELDISFDDSMQAYRFVYVLDEIALEFYAVTVNMWKETNQIESVSYYHIPYDKLKELEKPKLTLEEANAIARNYVDAKLTLEKDIKKRNRQSFIYLLDYPASPTGGHIEYVDAATGEIHWVDTGW